MGSFDQLHSSRPPRDVEAPGVTEVQQQRPGVVQQGEHAKRAVGGDQVEIRYAAPEQRVLLPEVVVDVESAEHRGGAPARLVHAQQFGHGLAEGFVTIVGVFASSIAPRNSEAAGWGANKGSRPCAHHDRRSPYPLVDDCTLTLVEKRHHIARGDREQPKSSFAAVLKAAVADPEGRRLRIAPRMPHLLGHDVPEAVFAAVEDAAVESERRRQAKRDNRSLDCAIVGCPRPRLVTSLWTSSVRPVRLSVTHSLTRSATGSHFQASASCLIAAPTPSGS
jgi:hypothetical protein